MTREVYITGAGAFLPGDPVDNDGMAERIGGGMPSPLRGRILAANGIRTRHYALDEHGATTMLNEELAAEAVGRALKDRGLDVIRLGLLATGTTQGDAIVPGFTGEPADERVEGAPALADPAQGAAVGEPAAGGPGPAGGQAPVTGRRGAAGRGWPPARSRSRARTAAR